eukprot:COSAG05_NODE_20701_length_277_cov_0.876404_1_plen_48_part_01
MQNETKPKQPSGAGNLFEHRILYNSIVLGGYNGFRCLFHPDILDLQRR